MVLESILDLQKAEKHPYYLFFASFAISSIAMFLAYKTFPNSSSVLAIELVTVAFMPIVHNLFIKEEEEEAMPLEDTPFAFITKHFNVIHIFGWIFLGMVFTYTFWATVLPETHDNCTGITCELPPKSLIFEEQRKVYTGITGNATIGSEQCFSDESRSFGDCFMFIFTNNAWVMFLAILFSFIWGAGAISLLNWNASVIGLFIGTEIIGKSLTAGLSRALSYLPHGLPEIIAYFVAAIAGGILSAAISKQSFAKDEIRLVLIDTFLLVVLASVTLFIAGFIEAAGIFGYWEAAGAGVIAFFALYAMLYLPSVGKRIDTVRRINL
ncbi:MAG: stage II sporulation protein M [Candidatus Diapherotrites archaeon]|uniref:Stage II sporulation protein M n=1 Tax=Candidatus Iainarchaeum sp. TaxID=3101447 RepID=A0A8T3YKS1_9ARCH|nr:stage II sporulation protein M [Candidatus Diapherotrites archaeon]